VFQDCEDSTIRSKKSKGIINMPDTIMYEEDNYVVLETNQPEQIITASELFEKLKDIVGKRKIEELSPDLRSFDSTEARVKYLIDTSCELDVGPGNYLQWYAVRLEK
jgi:Protein CHLORORESPIRATORY REDUCTION 7